MKIERINFEGTQHSNLIPSLSLWNDDDPQVFSLKVQIHWKDNIILN